MILSVFEVAYPHMFIVLLGYVQIVIYTLQGLNKIYWKFLQQTWHGIHEWRYGEIHCIPMTVCTLRVSSNVYSMAPLRTELLLVISMASWPTGESNLLAGNFHIMNLSCRWYRDEDFGDSATGSPLDDPNGQNESISSDESY